MAARCGRTKNVTSRPRLASSAPKKPPVAPAPTTRMRPRLGVVGWGSMVTFLSSRGARRRGAGCRSPGRRRGGAADLEGRGEEVELGVAGRVGDPGQQRAGGEPPGLEAG